MALNPKLNPWVDKRIWLIGASTGIGEALAEEFDRYGARCMISARSQDKLEQLAKKLRKTIAYAVDITQPNTLENAFSELIQQWGGVDLIVIMAGTYSEMAVKDFDLDKMKHQIEVNLIGTMNVLNQVLPRLLKQQSGHLCLVSSVAGFRGLPNSIAYGPSKAALINLAEGLYLELKPFNIGVSVVTPGFVDTPLTQKNTFPMPCIISAKKAAQHILAGLSRGQFEIHFPKKFTLALKLLSILPYRLYFSAVQRFTSKMAESKHDAH